MTGCFIFPFNFLERKPSEDRGALSGRERDREMSGKSLRAMSVVAAVGAGTLAVSVEGPAIAVAFVAVVAIGVAGAVVCKLIRHRRHSGGPPAPREAT